MQITEILRTIRKLFNSDIATGEVVLKLMKPENLLMSSWAVTCIQYYLYTKSYNPEKLFLLITNEPFMTEEIFVDGLSKKHDTFVGKKELQQLFHENCAGQMSLFEFTTLLDVKSYFEKKQIHMVDQLQFLNALIEDKYLYFFFQPKSTNTQKQSDA